jgi:hypothetical protein
MMILIDRNMQWDESKINPNMKYFSNGLQSTVVLTAPKYASGRICLLFNANILNDIIMNLYYILYKLLK